MPEERLQKILAQAGLGSRRACEELISAGRVTVDGRVVTELGTRVDPERVEIRLDGERIDSESHRYIMFHKPAGYLSHPDPRAGYPSWQDLVKVPERVFAVGRLDVDSEGLLLLTNDGALANRLTHPRYEHPKTYLVKVEGLPNPRKLRRWQHGVMLEDGPTAPAQVQLLRRLPSEFARLDRDKEEIPPPGRGRPASVWLRITIREGRKHQLRRMVSLLGHPALRVVRIGLGPLHLNDLRPGRWRDLAPGEIKSLRELLPPAGKAPRRRAARGAEEQKEAPLLPSTIAIDGPAASGKSTIGNALAQRLNYLYFDTGVMYRAVTWTALARGVPIEDETAVTQVAEEVRLDILPPKIDDGRDVTVLADGEDITWKIRSPQVDRAVSPVSTYPGVRAAMTAQQRRIGQAGRVIMVGRDIGTVVLPEAELKIYLDATLAERARRRHAERRARGEEVSLEAVLENLRQRDYTDSHRSTAPLSVAPDAFLIDSTEMDVVQVLTLVQTLIERWAERARVAR
jgi:cytidylate kinase